MTERVKTVVLDSEGVSAWVTHNRPFLAMLRVLQDTGAEPVISAATILEVTHPRVNLPRLRWVLSQVRIEPVTEAAARSAAELLTSSGMHGHRHAIDATVAEVAFRLPAPAAIMTSDIDDMKRLCGTRVRLIPL